MNRKPSFPILHSPFSKIWTCLALFLMAFLPRVFALDVFLTQDEPNWVKRSVRFSTALLSHDWPRTSQYGAPGVTTMWTGTLGLAARYFSHAISEGTPLSWASLSEFLQAVPIQLVDASYLAPMRFPTVLVTSVFAVAFYFLVKRLFDGRVALLSAALVALDPFYLAHSRLLHHDALVATFMTLSVLCFMVYLGQDRRLFFLVFSGLAAGLAFLSKTTSLFLVPFMGLLIVMSFVKEYQRHSTVRWREVGYWIPRLLTWMGIAILVFVVLWPAMWTDPALAVGTMTKKAQWSRPLTLTTSKGRPLVELLKYPATWLLRTTPLTLAGAGAALWFLSRKFRQGSRSVSSTDGSCQHSRGGLSKGDVVLGQSKERENLIALVLYMILFTIALSMAGAKFDRYLLAAFPALDIVSAWGLLQLQDKANSVLAGRFSSVAQWSRMQPMIGFMRLISPLLLHQSDCLHHSSRGRQWSGTGERNRISFNGARQTMWCGTSISGDLKERTTISVPWSRNTSCVSTASTMPGFTKCRTRSSARLYPLNILSRYSLATRSCSLGIVSMSGQLKVRAK